MINAILIQQIYPDTPGVKMLELTRDHHKNYCNKWQMDYRCEFTNPLPHCDPLKGSWGKIELIRQAMEQGYDYIIWLDADTLIIDMDTDLRDGVQPYKIGACWQRIPQWNHWNVGALYIDNCHAAEDFINEWLAMYPPSTSWLEQGDFNKMAHKSKTIVTLSDRWNATLDVSMVPDAVVLGFHGQGDTEYRYNLMRQAMSELFPEQKADAAQGLSEVSNG